VRYLILSDLHSNWEALQAVVRAAGTGYDRIICCGDLVGYGADPNAVVEWVRANCHVVVRGNHDKACSGQEDLEWFNPVARAGAIWTSQALSPENAAYVRDLPMGPLLLDGFQILHGSPWDEDDYVMGADEAGQAFGYMESRVAFFGHTHLQGGFIWNHSRIETIPPLSPRSARQSMEIDPACGYLINPGSVGQPRDGDPRAGYAVYDVDGRASVLYHRIPYDIEAAQKKIHKAGLPPYLAERLGVGR
jgi:predicted phosphodiesterase